MVTNEDLQRLRIQLIDDLKKIITHHVRKPSVTEWVKSGQVRKMLNAPPGTLQNLRIQGKLKGKKIGGSWYYNRQELLDLLEKE